MPPQPLPLPHSPRPPAAPRPRLARWLAPPGPPETRLLVHGDPPTAAVLAVPGRYCVSYLLVGPDSVCVVDCGSAADTSRILAALHGLGRPRSQLRFVLPTHLHFDHILGVDPLALRLGVPLALGGLAAELVRTGRTPRFPRGLLTLRALPTWPMQGLPVFPRRDWGSLDFGFPWGKNAFRAPLAHVFSDGDALPGFPGWSVLETPGHADDALCLHHAEAGWLVAGDTLRNFLGGEWNPLLVDAGAYAHTRARLAALPVHEVLPGHGPVFPAPGGLAPLPLRPWWQP
jgi:glyoxylase-like metal-dependent hydrolase (beta-lactamase superfamily II)